jgi:predicted GIY-YIG superfamily endonuclease
MKSFKVKLEQEISRIQKEILPRHLINDTNIVEQTYLQAELQALLNKRKFKHSKLKLSKDNRLSFDFFDTPCVYRLYLNNSLVYIGQTNDLLRRISQHKKDKIFDSFDVYCHEINDALRLNTEERLIKKHKPKYNIKHT